MRGARADFHALFRRSPVAMAVLDGDGAVLEANPALSTLLGRERASLVGTRLHEQVAIEDAGRFRPGSSDRRMRHQLGHDIWVLVRTVDLPEAGEGARLVCMEDATARHNTERLLLHAALHDSLTNLPNRRLLHDRLETALARSSRHDRSVAVLFVDLDRFKDVNDSLGHHAGDAVLVAVAHGIQAVLRADDTVARLGGDEFVVVCEAVESRESLVALAERLVGVVQRPLQVHGHTVTVRASIGIAESGPQTRSADEMIRAADAAMYRAKTSNARNYVFAHEVEPTGYVASSHLDQGLVADLRHAIQADLLELHYQPVARVDGLLVGLEALVRWRHPRLGLLLPHDFLPRVEGTELAGSLSDWVLRRAIRDAASWHDPRIPVSVNMWATEVARPGFADTVAMLLTWAGLQARSLYLELHERDIPRAGPGLADELNRLRRLSVGLAIDDFGTGGTSLAGLRRLPVTTLKADRCFVAGVVDDAADTAVVAAIATAAHAAGQHALATGVETPEQLFAVRALGYDSIQGYLAGAPAPLIDLRETIERRRVDLVEL